jgi:long-subunit acyl-CoA synthetase (AMP-forming)/alkylation response protein AidB-like acyl-CoA dehydrogenase
VMPSLVSPRQDAHASGITAAVSLVGLLAARCADAFDRRAVVDPLAADAAGGRSWTWGEIAAAAVRGAEALAAAGLRRGDRVAHLGGHGPDWIVVDLACLLAGIVHVAIHAAADPREQEQPLDWLGVHGVVVSDADARRRLSRAATGRIVVDLTGASLPAGGPAAERAAVEAAVARRMAACDPDACAAILLSSGTTGRPHGVLHSQRSLATNAIAAAEVFLDDPRDVRLSWLPLSHALARTGDLYTALVRGGCLCVVRDRSRLLDACRALPPTVILGVPAMFERLERGVNEGRISDLAAALGGEVRVCVSGGAPLRRRTAEFFAARGVPLVEGYGLAEAGPVVTLVNPRIERAGTVGPPVPGVDVRIDDRAGSRGQLLVRTPSRALGVVYPNADGDDRGAASGSSGNVEWLETGDLAEIDEAGHVRIVGRLRDVLVLANGVKAPPAAIEAAIAEDDAVAQVCVTVGVDGRPSAIIVPEPAVLRAAIRRMGLWVFSRRQALGHPRVRAWLARRLVRRQRSLPKAWRVGSFVIVGRPFEAARGETTESLKLRRDVIARNFAAAIASCGPVPAGGRPTREMSEENRGMKTNVSWLCGAVWQGDEGGFAEAAAHAAESPPAAVEAVLNNAAGEIARLRAASALYDALPQADVPAAPLPDAPPPPFGRLSAAAEAAVGETGLWGLAVPAEFGGSGCGMLHLARGITRLAANVPTIAGLLAVHSSIGAVSALTAFGTPDQKRRHLPGLAAGRPLSVFGATEPDAGCDLGRVASLLERRDGRLVLTGTKMFITGATHGRLVKLLAMLDGRPAVAIVQLPEADTPSFRLRSYALHPLRHAHNAALEFTGFEVDPADVLDPAAGTTAAAGEADAMRIVWHGLNRGRVTLAAQAAGTLRLLLAQARSHAAKRITWAAPIGSRQLVQGRLGRIAASIVACDAVSAWAAAAIDAGQSGEWEAITAKVVASTCVREGAIDALGVHGGRAFLVGHPLGDSLHDHFAVTVYEGESDLLGLALFKGLAKAHPLAGLRRDAPAFERAAAWVAWRAAALARGHGQDNDILDLALRSHAREARRLLAVAAGRIDRAIRRHGRGLAERQLEVGGLSGDIRELTSILAVAHHADAAGDDRLLPAADCWCRLALARVRGGRPSAADHAALAAFGAAVVRDGLPA